MLRPLSVRAALSAALCLLLLAPARADEKNPAPKQQEKTFEKEITVKLKMGYLLYLPEGYEKAEKPWPLLLFLHGAGEVGNDIKKVKVHGPPKLVEAGKPLPFVVVSPQSLRARRGRWRARPRGRRQAGRSRRGWTGRGRAQRPLRAGPARRHE